MKTKLILAGLIGFAGICNMNAQNASEYNNNAGILGFNCSAFGYGALAYNLFTTGNSAFGYQSMALNNGYFNTATGAFSMYNYNNSVGSSNTANGYYALYAANGNFNVAIGDSSLYSNAGNNNTAAGHASLFNNLSGNYNSAFGNAALYINEQGNANSGFGDSAMYALDYSSQNSAFGFNSLHGSIGSSGSYNTACGAFSLYKNTNGYSNTAMGDSSLFSNTTGYYNTAIGDHTLLKNTTGMQNTAIGEYALYNNTTGVSNVAVGPSCLLHNTTGNLNIGIGEGALLGNTTGNFNVAIGQTALSGNLKGTGNTAVGTNALIHSTNSNNTAIGYGSLASYSCTGTHNSALGSLSLIGNLSGSNNTGIGYNTLYMCTTGNQNTGVGYCANLASSNDTNATAIGANAIVNADNKVRLGDVNVTVVEGPVAYSFPSDARFKTNVKTEDVKGLEFIKKLRPVVYNFDAKKFTEFLTKNMPDSIKKNYLNKDFKVPTAIRQSGFIAQEVEQAAKEVGYDFNGVHKPNDDNDNYSLAYSQFVVPLVKAVQEQQQMIDTQNKTIEDLKSQLAAISSQSTIGVALGINSQQPAGNGSQLDGFSMDQNVPNPFTHETVIKYNLPQTVSSAYMAVYDLSGKQLTTFPIVQKGASSLTITSDKLAPGIYIYSIVADGTILGSKRMVIADK